MISVSFILAMPKSPIVSDHHLMVIVSCISWEMIIRQLTDMTSGWPLSCPDHCCLVLLSLLIALVMCVWHDWNLP